jgi:hypothetical protein
MIGMVRFELPNSFSLHATVVVPANEEENPTNGVVEEVEKERPVPVGEQRKTNGANKRPQVVGLGLGFEWGLVAATVVAAAAAAAAAAASADILVSTMLFTNAFIPVAYPEFTRSSSVAGTLPRNAVEGTT